MKKVEIKQWIKEHKTEIKIAVEATAGLALVGFGCYKLGTNKWRITKCDYLDEHIKGTLSVSGRRHYAGYDNVDGLTIEDLGVLGTKLVEVSGVPKTLKWERFVLVSTPLEN